MMINFHATFSRSSVYCVSISLLTATNEKAFLPTYSSCWMCVWRSLNKGSSAHWTCTWAPPCWSGNTLGNILPPAQVKSAQNTTDEESSQCSITWHLTFSCWPFFLISGRKCEVWKAFSLYVWRYCRQFVSRFSSPGFSFRFECGQQSLLFWCLNWESWIEISTGYYLNIPLGMLLLMQAICWQSSSIWNVLLWERSVLFMWAIRVCLTAVGLDHNVMQQTIIHSI